MRVVAEFGVATLAAALTYPVFALTEHSSAMLRWGLIGALALAALALAVFAARRHTRAEASESKEIVVGDRLSAKHTIGLKNIRIRSHGLPAVIGRNVRSRRGHIRISDVDVSAGDDGPRAE